MRRGYPTREQLQSSFERVLSQVLAGRGIPTGTGLDDETEGALETIARAHPNATEELVEAARRAFAGQLDGSNTARWKAELERDLAEREARSKRSQ
ncbi:MAG: hypothetical protein JWN03_3710 [Nocardia sp.]|uniref:hypothetical protein n=1 Tax=Nocardia sp. TaxID=1821 RepID=UPI00260CA66F|nr:hypothetical protein [Nocardia sp.]MCU1643435.1 hypothetical protein [Nocardia sp.]